MPGWPREQAHAALLRVARADRVYAGFDLSELGPALQPDRIVTAETLAADGIRMPEPDFYGELLLTSGATPVFLGQPVAMLIWRDFARFYAARRALRNIDVVRYGAETGFVERPPYLEARFVRVGGKEPGDADIFSPMQDGVARKVQSDGSSSEARRPQNNPQLEAYERAMQLSGEIRKMVAEPRHDWLVLQRRYQSQHVCMAAMEPDSGNAWYDRANAALHVVTGTQSPYKNALHIAEMMRAGSYPFRDLRFVAGSTVGYGSKEHHCFPYYVAVAGFYGDGVPVRLALNRFEHFQSALKRHPFWMDYTVAVDRLSGKLQVLRADLEADGGGRKNFSDSVGQVGVQALQSMYYLPVSDIGVTVRASRAVSCGSARGYGTLQTMVATELMMDELAAELNVDPIELRLRNVLETGMKNTSGSIPAGTLRCREVLEKARGHALWVERKRRKEEYERANPGLRYGVGFASVQKNYGTGAEAALVQIEIDARGRVHMKHVAVEIGTGCTTSMMQVVSEVLGKPADTAEFAVVDWPSLRLETDDEPYNTPQEKEDELARNPRWVPRITSPRSASNAAYFLAHATREAARILLERGLWPAALSIWSRGIGGGSAGSLTLRRENARWVDGKLTAKNLEPLPIERLAQEAHARGHVVGTTVHTFNRWAWAEAEFDIDGDRVRWPIDALSMKHGEGASPERKASMTEGGYAFIPRLRAHYPPVKRANGVTYYAPNACLVELSVQPGSGVVRLLSHHSIMECGRMIVPEFVHGQLEGGLAMGIGHALYEDLPLYEGGPGDGSWNYNRYRLPRARDVAPWRYTSEILDTLGPDDPPKGIAEVVMIPVIAAVANGVAHAIGRRFYSFPISPDKIREALL